MKTRDFLWNVHTRNNISFSNGKGSYLTRRNFFFKQYKYLDFNSGGGVNSLGYGNKKLVSSITKQAKKIWHLSNYYQNPLAEKLAKELCTLSNLEKAFFVNSGSEGVEFAFKIARKFFHNQGLAKHKVISIKNCYHGRTMGALSATENIKYTEGFGPLLDGFVNVEANIDSIENSIDEETAAIIVEPIQGNGGMIFLGWDFLQNLRSICDKYGILLILDEIQTGIGRTGKFFSYEYAQINPDILLLSKGIAGGFPFGCVLSTEKIANCIQSSGHGGTFGGNLLGVVAAREVVRQISNKAFLDNVTNLSKILQDEIKLIHHKFPHIIKEIRGFGLMKGLKINDSINPNLIVKKAIDSQLLLLGTANQNTIRITPPLVINEEEIKIGFKKLKNVLKSIN